MTKRTAETRGLLIALAGYVILAGLQFVAYFFTSFLVLLAEALHSLSDVLVSTFLLVALLWSRKPADEFHMFGHGRAQNVAGLVSATIFISFMSLEMFREAIPRLFQVAPPEYQNPMLALTVAVVAMVVTAIPLVDILRTKERGASAKAQLIGLLKDEASDLVALTGILLITQGYYWVDPWASIVVASAIAFAGYHLFQSNLHYLVGRAPPAEFMERISSVAKSVSGVLGVHDLKAEYVGPGLVHTGFHIEVAKGTPIEEADRLAELVKKRVSRETGCQHCVIHVDPARSSTSRRTRKNAKKMRPREAP